MKKEKRYATIDPCAIFSKMQILIAKKEHLFYNYLKEVDVL
jgi:hypothetical protein